MDLHRRELEREADRLGIGWTRDMATAALQHAVEARRNHGMNTEPEVKRVGDTYYVDGHEQPACFGEMWEAIDDSACMRCQSKDHCLPVFSTTALPQAFKVLGSEATREQVGELLNVRPEAIAVAMRYATERKKEELVRQGKTKKPPKKKVQKKPTKQTAAPKEQKTKRPPKAGPSAKRAAVPAKKKVKRATPAKARAGASPRRTWKKTEGRWERERQRSKLIAQLKPGQVLTREYPRKSGQVHTVAVRKGHYEYQSPRGKRTTFPTLYMLTVHIVGTRPAPKQMQGNKRPKGVRHLCPYSAPQFWRLDKLVKPKRKAKRHA